MIRLFAITFFSWLCLVSISSQAEPMATDNEVDAWLAEEALESEDLTLARPRPPGSRTVYRCCAKPWNKSGVMNCRQSTDKLLAWGLAITDCENKYGNGNCVSGCRRLLSP